MVIILWFSGGDGFPTLAVIGVAVPGAFIVAGVSYIVWTNWIKKLRSVHTIV